MIITNRFERILSFLFEGGAVSGILLENRNLTPQIHKMINGIIKIHAFHKPNSKSGINDIFSSFKLTKFV